MSGRLRHAAKEERDSEDSASESTSKGVRGRSVRKSESNVRTKVVNISWGEQPVAAVPPISSYDVFDLTKDSSNSDSESTRGKKKQQQLRKPTDSNEESAAPSSVPSSTSALAQVTSPTFTIGVESNLSSASKKKKNKKSKKAKAEARESATEDDMKTEGDLGSGDLTSVSNQQKHQRLLQETLVESVFQRQDHVNAANVRADATVPVAVAESSSQPIAATTATEETDSVAHKSSKWLSKFVNTNRLRIEDITVDEFEASNDSHLRLFAETFPTESLRGETSLEVPPAVDSNREKDSAKDEKEEEEEEGELIDEHGSIHEDDDEDGDVAKESALVKVVLFNLAFAVTEQEVYDFVASHNCTASKVQLGTKSNNSNNNGNSSNPAERDRDALPLGTACVDIAPAEGQSFDDILHQLHGKSHRGRIVRAEKHQDRNVRRRISFGLNGQSTSSTGPRYFVVDISCKCQSCGQVGHRTQDCINDALPVPCHLCAGCDHEANQCPNIICYRCGKFGHHSRACSSGNRPRPIVCFQCGSLEHDTSHCTDTNAKKKKKTPLSSECSPFESLLQGPHVICMRCKQTGHCLCKGSCASMRNSHRNAELPVQIYCPNCGLEGHHVDFPPQRGDANEFDISYYCLAPKCEAYYRFPQLRDMTNLSDGNHDSVFRSFARSNNDFLLFPSLSIPGRMNNRFSGNNTHHSGHKRFSAGDNEDDDVFEENYDRRGSGSFQNHKRVRREVSFSPNEGTRYSDSSHRPYESGRYDDNRRREYSHSPNVSHRNHNNSNSNSNSNSYGSNGQRLFSGEKRQRDSYPSHEYTSRQRYRDEGSNRGMIIRPLETRESASASKKRRFEEE